jgi:hypothetical protein
MNKFQAKSFAKNNSFKKYQIKEILSAAKKEFKDWEKSNPINPLFSYGSIFNDMIKWLEPYEENQVVSYFITEHVMRCFSKYSSFKLPKKQKYTGEITHSIPVDIDF